MHPKSRSGRIRPSLSAWQRLMTVLDSRPKSPSERTAIVPIVKSDPSTIQRAVALLQQLFSVAYPRRKQHKNNRRNPRPNRRHKNCKRSTT